MHGNLAAPESQGDTDALEDPAKRALLTSDRFLMFVLGSTTQRQQNNCW